MSITTTILSQGKALDPEYELLSIDTSKEVNRIPDATLTLIDGDAAGGTFPISDTKSFEPGTEIEIKLRYDDDPDNTLFKGLVVRHSVELGDGGSVLTVEMQDKAVKLTQPRKSFVYRDLSDDAIIGKVVQAAGLKKGTIDKTQPKHPEIVQYYCSDWDFVLSRADVQGLVVVADDGEISAKKVALSGAVKYTFEYGISSIVNFEIEIDAGSQQEKIESLAWDPKQQKLTQPAQAKAFKLSQGNLDGGKLAKTLGFDSGTLSHPVPVDPKELQAWADARMARNRLAMIRGRLAVPGLPDIKPLDIVEIKKLGARFNGKSLVTGVRHRVSKQGWQTDLQFGLSPDGYCARENIVDFAAAGLLPGVHGLQIGVVDTFEADPDKEFRAKVILPGIDEKTGSVWARLAMPDAGKERGFFFRPEAGDEVAVGFLNNDPRQPVVLGSLYSSKNAPFSEIEAPSEKNLQKAIVTRQGTTIGFSDDDKASVYIETPSKNRIEFSDDSEMVEISDQHGNSITMDKNGIKLKSSKDLAFEASGNVEIKGAKVDVK